MDIEDEIYELWRQTIKNIRDDAIEEAAKAAEAVDCNCCDFKGSYESKMVVEAIKKLKKWKGSEEKVRK